MGGLVRSAAACSYSYEPWAWGTTNFPASERRRSGVDGGFSPEPRVSSTCRLSASAQTRPPSLALVPSPARLGALRLSIPPPLPSSCLSPTFLRSPLLYSLLPHRPVASWLLGAAREEVSVRSRGACAARREALLLFLPGILGRLYVCVCACASV